MRFIRSDLSHINELAELARSTYDKGEIINVEYLNWEYNSNPDGKALVFLANEESKIVSQYVVVPRKYAIENEIINASLSLNTITHPAHRGKGYFTKLAELTYSECKKLNIDFTIGFPNKNSVSGFVNKLKFSGIGELPLMLKVVNPFRALYSFLFNSKVRDEYTYEFNIDLPKVSLLNLNSDLHKYNYFWSEFKKRNVYTTDRSAEFMRWRYIDIPIRKYQLFKIEKNGTIETVLILRSKNIFGVNCGIIVDLLTLKGNTEIGQLIDQLQKNKLDLIISSVPLDTPEAQCLKSAGFFKVPKLFMLKKLNVVLRIHSNNISSSITDFKKWFLTFGDYDIF